MRLRLMLLVGCALATAGAARAFDLYVSPDGNDAWSGRHASPLQGGDDGPFVSIERARDEIRALRSAGKLPAGPTTVHLRTGTYRLDSTLQLGAADSGTAEAPITYRAYAGETACVTGGREVRDFTPVSDPAVLARVDPTARPHLLQAELKSLGIADYGTVGPGGNKFELYFAGKPMTLARWPNADYTHVADILNEKPTTSHGFKGDLVGKFTYEGDRPDRWKGEDEIWLSGYWFWDWADQFQKVRSVDTDKKLISLVEPYHHYGYRKGQRFFALNLLSEIDRPGEYYLDRRNAVLYFWPPSDIGRAKAFVSVLGDLVAMKDVEHVTIRGLTFEFNRGTAVRIAGGAHVTVAGCTLHGIGGQAGRIEGGSDHAFVGCDAYDLGDGGISINGGDRMKLTPGRLAVVNCHFYRYSRNSRTYRPAVSLNGIGNRVAHCFIHDAPHMAIQFTGNEHVMEFNEIADVCNDTDDAGAIYTGRDWTWRDNVIRHNYFHHIGGYKTWVGTMSTYLDDFASASTVYGNVYYKGGRAVLIGGGRHNTVENNVFVDCTPAVHVDQRGTGWAKYFLDDPDNTMFKALRATPYKEPPWSTRYPDLVKVLDDEPARAKYNLIARNICVGGKWLDLHDGLTTEVVKVQDNLVNEDPMFVDVARQDFRLQAASPAFALGFKAIPIEQIGLYQDELRASWPPASRPE